MGVSHRPKRVAPRSVQTRELGTRLEGYRLLVGRASWVTLVVFTLGVFSTGIPAYVTQLQVVCTGCGYGNLQLTPESVRALHALGLSIGGYATVEAVVAIISAFIWFVVAVVIAWHRSSDWMALLVALMLVMVGATSITGKVTSASLAWQVASVVSSTLALFTLFLTFSLFPSGRFVPRWIGCLPLVYLLSTILGLSSSILVWVCLVGGLLFGQIYRYRHVSTPLQQQQTKWVFYGSSIVLLINLGKVLLAEIFSALDQPGSLYEVGNSTLFTLVTLLIPLSFGMAMARSHLWDIDIIINRTLVYGALTASLALVYFGLIFALQSLLRGLINQNNDVAIVVSTLAIAALFQPLRRRIQNIIDRRFYRRKYDAARTLAAFSATLRNEVDLDQLREDLVAVVEETMQPTFVSLWLRPPQRTGSHQAVWKSKPPMSPQQK